MWGQKIKNKKNKKYLLILTGHNICKLENELKVYH